MIIYISYIFSNFPKGIIIFCFWFLIIFVKTQFLDVFKSFSCRANRLSALEKDRFSTTLNRGAADQLLISKLNLLTSLAQQCFWKSGIVKEKGFSTPLAFSKSNPLALRESRTKTGGIDQIPGSRANSTRDRGKGKPTPLVLRNCGRKNSYGIREPGGQLRSWPSFFEFKIRKRVEFGRYASDVLPRF